MIFGKHINHFYWKYALSFILGIVALVIVDYLQLIIPDIIGSIIDGIETKTITESILLDYVIRTGILAVSIVIGRFLWRIFIFGTSRKIDYDMRNDLFAHSEKLSERYYQENKTGGLMAYFTNDLEAVRQSFAMGTIMVFDVLFLGGLAFYKMYLMDWGLTLIATIPLIMISLFAAFIGSITRKKFKARQKAFENMSDFTQENFYGIGVIKAFVNEVKEIRSFKTINIDNYDKNVAFIKAATMMHVAIEVFITLIRIIIIGFGGYLVYKTVGLADGDPNRFSVGQLATYISYFATMVWPMMAIGRLINLRSQAKASLERISAFLDQKIEIVDDENTIDVSHVEGNIVFNNLSFTYPGTRDEVLKNINFSINKGEIVGIIGRTGSGKTTLVDLLLRLYNLKENQILIDGYDIMKLPIKTIREAIGYVPQDNFIFSDSVRNNIAFAKDEVSYEQIVDMAEKSDVAENIEEFPEKYETIVGERGVTLSGGQKQRVSIARALIKDPEILIMDDSFSAVDTKTEEIILSNIKTLRKNKTTIIIAHRISTIKDADKIALIDEGQIVALGTHDELMSQSPLYNEMVLRQQLEEAIEGGVSDGK
ncbi:MAG: ABC transporter ATP-binding protein [Candidatus Izemoplasmatales bacterium]|jgi:ATP-binding cassette subfamily B protein|nr:ABC transporter ATP-binding protein [Candidatus Izemoplasmatales bacterium]MDD3865603.1 ABC transporter ATP-binding protein [Candidatus Izemoplasmatales bacterium]